VRLRAIVPESKIWGVVAVAYRDMASDDLEPRAVPALVRRLLGYSVAGVARMHGGFGGDTWRVDSSGGALVVKVAPASAERAKLLAATEAHRAAQAAGIPTPELVAASDDVPEFPGRLVRCYRWLDGVHPAASSPALADDLGRVLGRLHAVTMPTFSSRWGQTGQPTWAACVRWRIPQIRDRALRARAFEPAPLDDLLGVAASLADDVSATVQPSLTHRDLNPRNLLVDGDGRLTGILDFDGAEAWDPVVDLVRLRDGLIDGAREGRFLAAYPHPLPLLAERLGVVEILQHVNGIANARLAGDDAFEERQRTSLARTVERLASD
jgi:Ser/Thr protein kinase RdoA (MazF antagonist)